MPDPRKAPASERIAAIMGGLKEAYPDARIALNFSTPLECVIAVVLSAQSTDAKVNEVTPGLFVKYRKPEDYLAVPETELQADIHATGFFRQKTKALRGLSQKVIEDYAGEVPSTIAELVTLPGVARKTANIVQNNCFPSVAPKDPDAGVAVDTHVGRVAVRLGLTEHGPKEAPKIERDLMGLVHREDWFAVTDLFISLGRSVCDAKKPLCADCPIEALCPSSQEAGLDDRYRLAQKNGPKRRKPSTR